jgi:hypothetical protein
MIIAQVETIMNHSWRKGELKNICREHQHVFAIVAGNNSSFATNKTVTSTNKSGFFLFDWVLSVIGKISKPDTRVPASSIAFQDCELSKSGSLFGILKEAHA